MFFLGFGLPQFVAVVKKLLSICCTVMVVFFENVAHGFRTTKDPNTPDA